MTGAIAGGGAWPRPDDPAIVTSLGDALGLEPAVAHALPPAYLVATAGGRRTARAAGTPESPSSTRDRLWMQGGLIHLQSDEQQPGFLARASELTDLADLLPELEERILAAQGEIQELVAARAAVAETIHRAQEAAAALKQEQAGVRSRRDDLAGRHQRLAESEETLQREQARLASELARLGEVQLGLGGDLEGLEARHAAQERPVRRAPEGGRGGAQGARDPARPGCRPARAARRAHRAAAVDGPRERPAGARDRRRASARSRSG